LTYDVLIVGAGFAGSVIAERVASQLNKRVLMIDRRSHSGGNCFDTLDDDGILIHNYGPHLFHTDDQEVWDYLSHFTDWHDYHHKVVAHLDGKSVPIPFNLNTLSQLFPSSEARSLREKLIQEYGYGNKVTIMRLLGSPDSQLQRLAKYIYDHIFLNYSTKQWGKRPEEMDSSVTARVPILISEENGYFSDNYQAMPKGGYYKLFANLNDHENIDILLNTDHKDILGLDETDHSFTLYGEAFIGDVIFTGMLDELFDFRFGQLPYRSLKFQFERHKMVSYQQSTTVNYPNEHDYTRITEFKKMYHLHTDVTSIVKEFPLSFEHTKNTPYYPILTDDSRDMYDYYLKTSRKYDRLTLLGRLAEFKYYDMDDIVKRALSLYKKKFHAA